MAYSIVKRELGEVFVSDMDKIHVKLIVPCDGLTPKNDKHFPKNGKVDVTFFPDCQSFRVDIRLKDKNARTITKRWFKLRKLPGKIIPAESTWDTKKNGIEIKVKKEAETEDWTPIVTANRYRIDQESSDSDMESNDSHNSMSSD